MGSYVADGSVSLLPDEEKMKDPRYQAFDYSDFSIEGAAEYYTGGRDVFDWKDYGVTLYRDNVEWTFALRECVELLAKNEQGETVWIPGPEAPYEDCWEGEYLGKVRPCRYLHVRRRDTENHTTKVGKVFLREGEQMSRLSLNRLLDRLRSYGFKVYGE